jgi:hypothetical protein
MIISLVMPATPQWFARRISPARHRRNGDGRLTCAHREDVAQDESEDEWH